MNDNCAGASLDFTYPVEAIEIFVSEAVSVGTFLLTIAAKSLAAEVSVNEAKGINAFRCALTSIFDNVSNLALAAYYALKEFNSAYLIQDYVIEAYYPNVCTCLEEIEKFGEYITGASEGEDTNAKYVGICSEAAYNQANNVTSS